MTTFLSGTALPLLGHATFDAFDRSVATNPTARLINHAVIPSGAGRFFLPRSLLRTRRPAQSRNLSSMSAAKTGAANVSCVFEFTPAFMCSSRLPPTTHHFERSKPALSLFRFIPTCPGRLSLRSQRLCVRLAFGSPMKAMILAAAGFIFSELCVLCVLNAFCVNSFFVSRVLL